MRFRTGDEVKVDSGSVYGRNGASGIVIEDTGRFFYDYKVAFADGGTEWFDDRDLIRITEEEMK